MQEDFGDLMIFPMRGCGSRGLDDEIAVDRLVSGADEADGIGDAGLELVVREPGDLESGHGLFVAGDDIGGVVLEEFPGLHDFADFEDGADEVEDVQHGWDAVGERDIDGFDLRPIGESPVGDDQRVGVADAGEQIEDVWIEDAVLEHARRLGDRPRFVDKGYCVLAIRPGWF